MNEDDLRKLEAAGSELAFAAGRVLIEHGEPGTGAEIDRLCAEDPAFAEPPAGSS